MAKDWLVLTHPDDRDGSQRLRDQIQHGLISTAEFEKRFIGKPGNVISVRVRIAMVNHPDGTEGYFIAHVEDITASMLATNALNASEERYRMLFARNLAGVIRTTRAGQILDCNQAAALILGFSSPAELVGVSFLEFHDPSSQPELLMHELNMRRVVMNYELKIRRRDGKRLWVLGNISLVEEGDGGTLEGTLVDITDRKQGGGTTP